MVWVLLSALGLVLAILVQELGLALVFLVVPGALVSVLVRESEWEPAQVSARHLERHLVLGRESVQPELHYEPTDPIDKRFQ